MRLRVVDFKTCDYREIWEVQKQIFNGLLALKKSKEKPVEEFMLIGEHFPVYTLGFHGNAANLLADEKRLAKMGLNVSGLKGEETLRIMVRSDDRISVDRP